MISRFRDFIKISFVKDVGILQIAKFVSIFLSMASSVFLARFLGPESYGIYGLVFAFVGLVGIFTDWGANYASLTLLAENYSKGNREEIKNILVYFMKVSFLGFGIVGILALIFAPLLTDVIYENSQIGNLARVVLLATFMGVFYTGLVIVMQVIRKITQLAILETVNKFIYVLLPVSFVFFGWGLTGLVWAHLLSSFIFVIISLFVYRSLTRKDNLLPNVRKVFADFKGIKIRKYFRFGFLIAVDKNLGRLTALLPVLLLGVLASVEDVGFFKIAFGYIVIPSLLLGPVSRLLAVQLPKSKTLGGDMLKKHFFKTALYSGFIAILLVIPFIAFAPYLIKFFYGAEYVSSIELVYYMAIMVVLSGFGVGLGSLYRTINRMKISIIINGLQPLVILLLVFILLKFYDPLVAVTLSYALSAVLIIIPQFLIIKGILKNYGKN